MSICQRVCVNDFLSYINVDTEASRQPKLENSGSELARRRRGKKICFAEGFSAKERQGAGKNSMRALSRVEGCQLRESFALLLEGWMIVLVFFSVVRDCVVTLLGCSFGIHENGVYQTPCLRRLRRGGL